MEESTTTVTAGTSINAEINGELEILTVTSEQIIAAHKEVVDVTWRLMEIGNSFVEKAAVVGRLLIIKKAEVGYGHFLPWLAENIKEFGCRTAQDYMKAARYVENTNHAAYLDDGKPITMRYVQNLRQAVGFLDDKSPSDQEDRKKPAFVIRCVFNVEPEQLDELQRRTAFDQAMPLLLAFQHFGFIEIKA